MEKVQAGPDGGAGGRAPAERRDAFRVGVLELRVSGVRSRVEILLRGWRLGRRRARWGCWWGRARGKEWCASYTLRLKSSKTLNPTPYTLNAKP